MTGDECPYCGYDELSSHYHCGNCGEESSSIGHWNGFDSFTCEGTDFWKEVLNERED